MINDLDMMMIVLIEESLLTTSRAALRVYMVDWTVSFGQCTVHIVHCTLYKEHILHSTNIRVAKNICLLLWTKAKEEAKRAENKMKKVFIV